MKLWVIEWEELIIKDMAMHTIVLLLEAAGNVNRKAKVFHAMHNWILNGLLMTLAGASNNIAVFYTHIHYTYIHTKSGGKTLEKPSTSAASFSVLPGAILGQNVIFQDL